MLTNTKNEDIFVHFLSISVITSNFLILYRIVILLAAMCHAVVFHIPEVPYNSYNYYNILCILQDVAELTPDTVLISKQPFIANFTYHLRNQARNTPDDEILGHIDVSHFGILLINREVFNGIN